MMNVSLMEVGETTRREMQQQCSVVKGAARMCFMLSAGFEAGGGKLQDSGES